MQDASPAQWERMVRLLQGLPTRQHHQAVRGSGRGADSGGGPFCQYGTALVTKTRHTETEQSQGDR